MAVTVAPATIPDPRLNIAYSVDIDASGETAPYTFTVFSGTLPTGLALAASTGIISGTPTALGEFTFVIRATDSDEPVNTDDQEYTVTVVPGNEITNSQVDAAAAAVPAPYGPLTRVTDLDTSVLPNVNQRFEFTDANGETVWATYDELTDAEAIQRQISLANGFQYTMNGLMADIASLNSWRTSIYNSSGVGYTRAEFAETIERLRNIREISGFN